MNRWWLKLLRYAAPQSGSLILIALLMHSVIATKLLAPWPLKLIVDNVLAKQPFPANLSWIERLPGAGAAHGQLAWFAGATVLLFLARRLLAIAQNYLETGASTQMVYDLGGDIFRRLQQKSLLYHGRRPVGDLLTRVTTDASCIRELVMNVYVPLVSSIVMLVSMFAIMWHLHPLLATAALGMSVPLGLVIKLLAGPMAERKYQQRELQGEVMSLTEQVLTAVPLVQAFGREQHEDERFRGLAGKTLRVNMRSAVLDEQFKIGTGAFSAAATAIAMLVGGSHVLSGALTVGDLLVLIAYFNSLYSPLETMAYLASGFAGARAGGRRVLEVLESEDDSVPEAPDAKPLPDRPRSARGHVRIDGVTFGYDPGRPVLRDVSIEAFPGETIALVGHTGAGKSTLVALLARLVDPAQGSVHIDGMDLRSVKFESLRRSIAVLLQEPFLLPLTIAENIAYGRPDATESEIIAAARSAQAHDFIERLPGGYATLIGERGATLSGGERQRLAIARAFLVDAPILILDEPTASLDVKTETGLLDALERLAGGRTTFIIAHRLSTIRNARRIVVLEAGRVIEMGTHAELMASRGAYWRLQRLQAGGTLPTEQLV